jgi:dihydropteroate synthase
MTGERTAESVCGVAPEFEIRLPDGRLLTLGGQRRARVMGILNVTPDSFSDGGLFVEKDAAIAQGEAMAAEGADVIDVGGESTRPGSDPVPPDTQLARVIPVIQALARRVSAPISIDTTDAQVARHALDAGAQIVNDVSALRADPDMATVIARAGVPVVLMHMLGRPRDMQDNPTYRDVVEEVREFLAHRVEAAVEHGIDEGQIIVDPGFGFGKTAEHNLTLLRELAALEAVGRPVMVGTSRKAMLGKILDVPPRERIFGTAATVAAAVDRGAAIVRVHDVRAAVHVVKVMAAIHGRSWS